MEFLKTVSFVTHVPKAEHFFFHFAFFSFFFSPDRSRHLFSFLSAVIVVVVIPAAAVAASPTASPRREPAPHAVIPTPPATASPAVTSSPSQELPRGLVRKGTCRRERGKKERREEEEREKKVSCEKECASCSLSFAPATRNGARALEAAKSLSREISGSSFRSIVRKERKEVKERERKKTPRSSVLLPPAAAAAVEAAKARHTATTRMIKDVRMIILCFEVLGGRACVASGSLRVEKIIEKRN